MTTFKSIAFTIAALGVAGCTTLAPIPNYSELVKQMMGNSFRNEGIASTDRLIQDEANAACSEAQGGNPPEAITESIQQAALKLSLIHI